MLSQNMPFLAVTKSKEVLSEKKISTDEWIQLSRKNILKNRTLDGVRVQIHI